MFYYFIEDYRQIYKEKIEFKDAVKNMKKSDWIKIVTLLSVPILGVLFGSIYIYWLTSLLLFLLLIIISYWNQKKWKKMNKIYLENYKKKKIDPLVKLLKAKEYHLDSIKGIDWLVTMCDRCLSENSMSAQLGKPFVIFFHKLLLPITTFIYGCVIAQASAKEKIGLSLLLVCILMFILGFWYIVLRIIVSLIDKDKKMIEVLRNDLLYIKLSYSS
ncbi:hypothetical protein [[Clostridium] hylemonae]|uniref:hypothetical protein n=1 Tax=[Clostridium] hylemonae TaxID=89153 RepID=UPI0011065C31|nr:hypothetical protein [[Clostridium] hylemonae]